MFGDFNPFATPIFGDWLEMPKFGKDPDKHLGDVYLNGVSFFESTTLEGVYDPQPRDTDEDFALKIPCPVPDVALKWRRPLEIGRRLPRSSGA